MANDPDNAPIGEDPKIDSLEQRIAAARKTEDERVAKEHAPVVRTIGMQVISQYVGTYNNIMDQAENLTN